MLKKYISQMLEVIYYCHSLIKWFSSSKLGVVHYTKSLITRVYRQFTLQSTLRLRINEPNQHLHHIWITREKNLRMWYALKEQYQLLNTLKADISLSETERKQKLLFTHVHLKTNCNIYLSDCLKILRRQVSEICSIKQRAMESERRASKFYFIYVSS